MASGYSGMTIHKVFLQSIFTTLLFRCDACSKFLAVSNVSDKECLTKVKEHWARAHNVSCAPRYTRVTCLGYRDTRAPMTRAQSCSEAERRSWRTSMTRTQSGCC